MSSTVTILIDNTTREFSREDWNRIVAGEMDVDSPVLRYVIKEQYDFIQQLTEVEAKDTATIADLLKNERELVDEVTWLRGDVEMLEGKLAESQRSYQLLMQKFDALSVEKEAAQEALKRGNTRRKKKVEDA